MISGLWPVTRTLCNKMIEKHSLNLQGHPTSVSLEPEFWREFKNIATREGQGVNQLAAEIDATRDVDTNLASAIRLFVLRDLRARIQA